MPMSPEDHERLKKVALKATALVVGGAVVKYVWENGVPIGYVYHFRDTKNTFVGLLKRAGLPEQFSGKIVENEGKADFVPDKSDIGSDTITEMERVFESAENEETS